MSHSTAKTSVKGLLPLLLLCLCLSLGACSSRQQVLLTPDDETLNFDTLIVAPFEVRYPAEPWASYRRTVEEVNLASGLNRFAVYSYGDFDAFVQDGKTMYTGTSMQTMVKEAALQPEQVVVLRGSAVAMGPTPMNRRVRGQPSSAELELQLSVQLFHLGKRMVIAQAETTLFVSPLDRDGGSDPYPELSKQHESLVKRVLDAAMTLNDGELAPPLPISVLEKHHRAFAIGSDDTPSVQVQNGQLNAFEQSTMALKIYEWFYPDISPSQVADLEDSKGGLLVTSSLAPKIEAGDIITTINGMPIEAAHQLNRLWFNLLPGMSLQLDISRQGLKKYTELEKPQD